MRSAETTAASAGLPEIEEQVQMPATEGRRYTFLVGLGYDKLYAAGVAVGREPAPNDLAERYRRSAAAGAGRSDR